MASAPEHMVDYPLPQVDGVSLGKDRHDLDNRKSSTIPNPPSDSPYGSKSSDGSSSASPVIDSSPDRLRKRKLKRPNESKSRLKRLRGYYNDEYRKLLNHTIDEVTAKVLSKEGTSLQASQIGVTIWAPEEKDLFFRALARKGRDDLRGIAAMVGTKTELEIHLYIDLLQGAKSEQHLCDRSDQLPKLSRIAGAFELSQDCSDALDLSAEALCVLQQKTELTSEMKKHGELSLLNAKTAKWVDRHLSGEGAGESEISKALPAAELLNLTRILELSAHVFMNSTVAENNWRSYSKRHETPSILNTAFSDIHRLAISVTKRLVQSSTFFAMSRIKSMDSSKYANRQAVRREDVSTALDVLGMRANSQSFWVKAARRCKLDVYNDIRGKMVKGERLSYEDVESRLSQGNDNQAELNPMVPKGPEPSSPVEWNNSDVSRSEYTTDNPSDSSVSSEDVEMSQRRRRKHCVTHECFEYDHDSYAEALDQQASQREEQRLWEMLGREPPDNIKPEDVTLPLIFRGENKVADNLDDWRSCVDYVGDWSMHDLPVLERSLVKNRSRLEEKRSMSLLGSSAPSRQLVDADEVDSGIGDGALQEEVDKSRSSDEDGQDEDGNKSESELTHSGSDQSLMAKAVAREEPDDGATGPPSILGRGHRGGNSDAQTYGDDFMDD